MNFDLDPKQQTLIRIRNKIEFETKSEPDPKQPLIRIPLKLGTESDTNSDPDPRQNPIRIQQ